MHLTMRLDVAQELKVIMVNLVVAPAVKGKARCRVHGGAKGSGAKPGNMNALKWRIYSGSKGF